MSHVKKLCEVISVVDISLLQKYLFSYSIPMYIERSVFVAHLTDKLLIYRVRLDNFTEEDLVSSPIKYRHVRSQTYKGGTRLVSILSCLRL
jgi:hypothetical protein